VNERLAGAVRVAFGAGRKLTGTERLRGGSQKGVYRLTVDSGATAVAYVWDPAENFWPAPSAASTAAPDPFSHASGPDLFATNQAYLSALGVRTPEILFLENDVALVEDVRGGTLEALLERDPEGGARTLERLAGDLWRMWRHSGQFLGKVPTVQSGLTPQDRPAERVVLDRAVRHLAEAAARVPRIATVHDVLSDVLHELAAEVPPRREYGLIHGELGPDHVLVDAAGDPVLIDIEGLMFFDVEWEHAFLRIRFGEHYPSLRVDGLDERRLRLYRLALHLSLVAGPLRLLDNERFSDRAPMQEIADTHTEQALAFARTAT
jgi:hypothetical protein